MEKYIEDYKNSPAINQSRLKKLIGFNPKRYENNEIETSSGFTMGSLVDCLLTRPADFDDEYYVSNLTNLPSDKIIAICQQYYQTVTFANLEQTMEHKDLLLGAIKQIGYQPNWGDDKLVESVRKNGSAYYNELVEAGDRDIISISQYERAVECAANVRSTFPEVFDDISTTYQVAFYGKYKNHDTKCLIDAMKINEEKKEIDIYDLKTMSDMTTKFLTSLRKYRYDLQMAYYKEHVRQKYPDYTIRCHFIVESTETPGTPLMYTCSSDLLYIGQYGGTVKTTELMNPYSVGTTVIEGFDQLFDKLEYYEKNGFDTDLRIVKSNSRLTLSWTGSTELYGYENIE